MTSLSGVVGYLCALDGTPLYTAGASCPATTVIPAASLAP